MGDEMVGWGNGGGMGAGGIAPQLRIYCAHFPYLPYSIEQRLPTLET